MSINSKKELSCKNLNELYKLPDEKKRKNSNKIELFFCCE